MNTARQVEDKILALKNSGIPPADAAWQAALACVGWPYIFGARGQECTPAYRRQVSGKDPEKAEYKNVRDKCQAINGTAGSCSGCKWFPGGCRVRSFDCRGFPYWILLQIYGWKLQGAGATSQWNTESNWKAKGEVADGIPQNVIVCLFYYKKDKSGKRTKTLEHTGLYYNGETCECSNGVQHFTTLNKKWEVWAVPACVDAEAADPSWRPTLRKGDSGPYVTLAQTKLLQRGYDLGKWGADGKFGAQTEKAVKLFQQDWNLKVDGVIGPETFRMLESTPAKKAVYTVTVPGLTAAEADEICERYAGAYMTQEG